MSFIVEKLTMFMCTICVFITLALDFFAIRCQSSSAAHMGIYAGITIRTKKAHNIHIEHSYN